MKISDDLPNISRLARSLRKVPDCPKKVDMACIFCLECDKAEYREIEYEDGVIRMTRNSMQINIKFPSIRDDPINKALLTEIMRQLALKHRVILEEPESGYDVTFFLFYSDPAANAGVITTIIKKLEDVMGILTEGRLAIKNWARGIVEKYFSV